MIIEAHQITFSYDEHPILKNVSFQVFSGEFIGIIGPNGGGKTTLLKLIMGFLKPSKGALQVHGKISYVPQLNRVDRDFPISVEEIILLGAISQISYWQRYPKQVLAKADALMEQFGLIHYKKKAFGSLSGGLAQKTLLARALISEPDLLLLDEPTANIDPPSSKKIFEILESFKDTKTILLVTHDLKTIVEKVDRILCVQGNVQSYAPKEICEHFALGLYHTPLIDMPMGHFNKEKADALSLL